MAVEKRAMNDKDKMKRKEKILKSALQLFKKNNGKLPTVSVIAQKAGLSKGSVYLYFKTKNELFLYLFILQLREWHESVEKQIKKCNDRITIEKYAELTSAYLVKHPMVLKMGSVVTRVLEESVDEKVILELKVELARLLDDRSRLTYRLFPGLAVDQWMNVHLRVYALLFGLWQMFYSTPHFHEILERGENGIFEPDFFKSASNSIATFLKGALNNEQ
jgi:AcrR family transcriptional regulator